MTSTPHQTFYNSDVPLTVLKFGSSVLTDAAQCPKAVHEIYQHFRKNQRILVVVSALGETTDHLLATAAQVHDNPETPKNALTLAKLLATGEQQASLLLALALSQAGLSATCLDYQYLKTTDDHLDASPYALEVEAIYNKLQIYPIVIIPGFMGTNGTGDLTLLGRGGSDLTALFCAWTLRAQHCCLIKDVAGVYDTDPHQNTHAHCFKQLTFQRALTQNSPIIQHKALQFAADKQYRFTVKALNQIEGTLVGSDEDIFYPHFTSAAPLRVVLLGLGTVGLGVYHLLKQAAQDFTVVGIAVHHKQKHQHTDIPEHLISDSALAVLAKPCDIVVECIGGVDNAFLWIKTALSSKRAVVSANKAVIAEHGEQLHQIAHAHNTTLTYSAAVGGVLPVLETLTQIKASHEITRFQGILNSTANYILDTMEQGASMQAALQAAQEAGFAEADPTLDLNGTDVLQKAIIAARYAFSQVPTQISCSGIEAITAKDIQKALAQGHQLRLVATAIQKKEGLTLDVAPLALPLDHPLNRVAGANNRILIQAKNAQPILLESQGAGRWPTAESVFADILDIRLRFEQHILVNTPQPLVTSAYPLEAHL